MVAGSRWRYGIKIENNVSAATRAGTKLHADIYCPTAGRVCVILPPVIS